MVNFSDEIHKPTWFVEEGAWEDPRPPDDMATLPEEEQFAYMKVLLLHSVTFRKYASQNDVTAKDLWKDMHFMIRPKNWYLMHKYGTDSNPTEGKVEIRKWRDLIKSKDIQLPEATGSTPIWTTLVKVFHQTDAFPPSPKYVDPLDARGPPGPAQLSAAEATAGSFAEALTTCQNPGPGSMAQGTTSGANGFNNGARSQRLASEETGAHGQVPAADEPRDHLPPGSQGPFQSRQDGRPSYNTSSSRTSDSAKDTSYKINSVSKLMFGREQFTGGDQDIATIFDEFETVMSSQDMQDHEMIKAVFLILKGPPLKFYKTHIQGKVHTWSELKKRLFENYRTEELKTRMLREWQETRLSIKLQEGSPDESERDVFVRVIQRLRHIQCLLDSEYSSDRFLRDQMQIVADIPKIKDAFQFKPADTALDAEQRIAAFLSTAPGSAAGGHHGYSAEINEANYGSSNRFAGRAKKNFRGFSRRPAPRGSRGPRKKFAGKCWVCGEQHMARDHHSKVQITEAFKKKGMSNSESANMASAFLSMDVEEVYDYEEIEADAASVADAADVEAEPETEGYVAAETEGHVAAMIDELPAVALSRYQDTAFLAADQQMTECYAGDIDEKVREMEKDLKDKVESKTPFKGLLMDTGANRNSMISLRQLRFYAMQYGMLPVIKNRQRKRINGISSPVMSIGTVTLPIPFPELGIREDIDFIVIEEDCTTLFCLKDMKQNGFSLDLQSDELIAFDRRQKLLLTNFQLWHTFNIEDFDTYCGISMEEARQLHKSFGHPSVQKLANLLEKSDPDNLDGLRKMLQDLTDNCRDCQLHAAKPKRFKLSCSLSDDIRFNHEVEVDIMYLNSKPALHVVCTQTKFQAAAFLSSVSAGEVWATMKRIWLHVYTGPPDLAKIDQGSQFVSTEFKRELEEAGVEIKEAPVECPTTLSRVERYHAPLRSAYLKILESEKDRNVALQHAVFSVNSTVGPEGLIPVLLVFGTIPKPARRAPAETQVRRAHAVEAARKEILKVHAKNKLKVGLKYTGPYGNTFNDLRKLKPGDPVRVYRPKLKMWEPHRFVELDGETVTVANDSGRRMFRSTVVKPLRAEDEILNKKELQVLFGKDDETPDIAFLSSIDGETTQNDDPWRKSRLAEVNGLIDGQVLKAVKRSVVKDSERIYGCRFVDTIKPDGTRKSRLVAQNYRDHAARGIPTRSPTITRAAQRVALSFGASQRGYTVEFRDVSQAYTQSKEQLGRRVFLAVPDGARTYLGMEDDEVLLCLKPLYGIPESGLLWFLTFSEHHIESLNMVQCPADRCLFVERGNDGSSIVAIQVDDSMQVGDKKFFEKEEREGKKFKSKPRVALHDGSTYLFNGVHISRKGENIITSQKDKLDRLKECKTEEELISTRAAIQYVGTCTRPDLAAPSQLLAAEVRSPTDITWKDAAKLLKFCKATTDDTLTFVPLELDSLRIVVLTDASFANCVGFKSQLGFVVVLTDGVRANIVDWGSSASTRVTRSVLAAELLAMVLGFDRAYAVREMVKSIIGREVDITSVVDSQTAFHTVTKLSGTLEKRLAIDVYALQESHRLGDLTRVVWVARDYMVADPLTHRQIREQSALKTLMRSNVLRLPEEGASYRMSNKPDLASVGE